MQIAIYSETVKFFRQMALISVISMPRQREIKRESAFTNRVVTELTVILRLNALAFVSLANKFLS
jgi:hypothetical protein